MRLKAEAILDFGPADDEPQNKIVREYRDQYKAISEILVTLYATAFYIPSERPVGTPL